MSKSTYKGPTCDPGRCLLPRGHLGLCQNANALFGTRNQCVKIGFDARIEADLKRPQDYSYQAAERETGTTGERDVCMHVAKKPRPTSPETKTDNYDSMAKKVHRAEFAIAAETAYKNYLKEGGDPNQFRILYLETAAAAATEALLLYGLPEHVLYPCNKSSLEMEAIQETYPKLHALVGDIYDAFAERFFQVVWFDTEETWLDLDSPSQDWKHDLMPKFWSATVVAISLSSRRVEGGPGAFANELQKLIEAKGGTLDQGARDYRGRSGVTNMIFALATFPCKLPPASHYFLKTVHVPLSTFPGWTANNAYEKVMLADGTAGLVGVVTSWTDQSKTSAFINYMNTQKHYFENNDVDFPLSLAQVRKYCIEM